MLEDVLPLFRCILRADESWLFLTILYREHTVIQVEAVEGEMRRATVTTWRYEGLGLFARTVAVRRVQAVDQCCFREKCFRPVQGTIPFFSFSARL